MKVYSIPRHDRGYINVVVFVQSCTDPLQVMAGSSSETFPTSSDGTYDVSNIKVEEEETNLQEFEVVNVKTENIIFSEEEECIDIKDEEDVYTEEEEVEEENIDTKADKDVDVKEEVS